MKADKTKSTVIALVALLVICGGSFIGVKALNNRSNTVVPPVVATTTSIDAQTTMTDLITTTALPETPTLPTATTTEKESQTTTKEETKKETTTTEKKETTTTAVQNITTQPSSTAPETTDKMNEAQEVINSAAVFSEGFLGYLFNPDGDYYFTNSDPWQRNFGFNELYDIGAPFLVFYYDTMRCKFHYDKKDWLIQFWKGQYGFVFIGAEIGVYNKPEDRETAHYDCASDEDSLMMSMTCYRKGKEIFTRDYMKYWWCTGFVPGKLDKFSDRSELQMKCRITMVDYSMLMNFCGALKENGLEMNKDFTTSGLDVFVTW